MAILPDRPPTPRGARLLAVTLPAHSPDWVLFGRKGYYRGVPPLWGSHHQANHSDTGPISENPNTAKFFHSSKFPLFPSHHASRAPNSFAISLLRAVERLLLDHNRPKSTSTILYETTLRPNNISMAQRYRWPVRPPKQPQNDRHQSCRKRTACYGMACRLGGCCGSAGKPTLRQGLFARSTFPLTVGRRAAALEAAVSHSTKRGSFQVPPTGGTPVPVLRLHVNIIFPHRAKLYYYDKRANLVLGVCGGGAKARKTGRAAENFLGAARPRTPGF